MSTSPANPPISKVLHALVFAWSLVMFFKAYPGLVPRAIWQHAKYKGDVLVQGTAAMYLGGAYALIGLALLAALSAEYGWSNGYPSSWPDCSWRRRLGWARSASWHGIEQQRVAQTSCEAFNSFLR